MKRIRTSVVGMVAALGCIAAPASAENAGFSLTLEVPETYRSGTAFGVSGWLRAHAAAPIVFEYAHGVPSQVVEILVDGEVVAQDQTNAEGFYTASLTFDWRQPTTRTIQARALTQTPLPEYSRVAQTRLDQILLSLETRPGSLSLALGAAAALAAWAEDGDGRFVNVSSETQWTSSDDSVATVSPTGVVHAVSPGTATITGSVRNLHANAPISVG